MNRFFILMFILFSSFILNAQDRYPFDTLKKEAQFEHLIKELRCMVCSNQNLAESNAPLAMDMKQEIYEQINQGRSDHDIIEFMTLRYGDVILFKPPIKSMTWFLWFAPLIFFFIGFWKFLKMVHRGQA
jgi:cytochrome c-type biogenesis protein CcmH